MSHSSSSSSPPPLLLSEIERRSPVGISYYPISHAENLQHLPQTDGQLPIGTRKDLVSAAVTVTSVTSRAVLSSPSSSYPPSRDSGFVVCPSLLMQSLSPSPPNKTNPPIDQLPYDLLLLIMAMIPFQSAKNICSVSKKWRALFICSRRTLSFPPLPLQEIKSWLTPCYPIKSCEQSTTSAPLSSPSLTSPTTLSSQTPMSLSSSSIMTKKSSSHISIPLQSLTTASTSTSTLSTSIPASSHSDQAPTTMIETDQTNDQYLQPFVNHLRITCDCTSLNPMLKDLVSLHLLPSDAPSHLRWEQEQREEEEYQRIFHLENVDSRPSSTLSSPRSEDSETNESSISSTSRSSSASLSLDRKGNFALQRRSRIAPICPSLLPIRKLRIQGSLQIPRGSGTRRVQNRCRPDVDLFIRLFSLTSNLHKLSLHNISVRRFLPQLVDCLASSCVNIFSLSFTMCRIGKALEKSPLSINDIHLLPFASVQRTVLHPNASHSVQLKPTVECFEVFSALPLKRLKLRHNKMIKLAADATLDLPSSLKILKISGNQIGRVPSNLSLIVPNLERLSLKSCEIKQWKDDDLIPPQLRTLILSVNGLNSLPSDASNVWDALSKLEYLALSSNKLTHLPPRFAHNLSSLTHLDLDNNRLSLLHDHIFVGLKSLSVLQISNNTLTALPESIGELKNLRKLKLSQNLLTDLPHSTSSLSSLELIDVACNQLTNFPTCFSSLFLLRKVNCSKNLLSFIPPEAFHCHEGLLASNKEEGKDREREEKKEEEKELRTVGEETEGEDEISLPISTFACWTEFDLQYNRIESLPDSITRLSALQILRLDHNQLFQIPNQIGALSNLASLFLSNNQISTIPSTISLLGALQNCDLSFNHLSHLSDDLFQVDSLTSLNLAHNKLSSLSSSISSLTNLLELKLEFNSLTELPEEFCQHCSKLTLLQVASNCLLNLPNSIGLCAELSVLHCHDNPLSAAKAMGLPISLRNLTKLQSLPLHRNQLPPDLPPELWFLRGGKVGKKLRSLTHPLVESVL